MPQLLPPTDSPETPDAELARLRLENAALCATVAEQAALIAQLQQRLQELEARLAKNSRNSSKPPSTDPPFKKPPPRSQRQVSGRQPGGQKDHPGVTRELVDHPEQTVVVPPAPVAVNCPAWTWRPCPSAARSSTWSSAGKSPSIGRWPAGIR